jgi:hypothetical protein
VRGVDVGVAEAGGLDLDPDLADLERPAGHVLDAERGMELVDDRRAVSIDGRLGRG